ncbi:Cyanobacterial phytochrome B [Lachnellula willkommii]|uniref:Cyanobacterial phytochrome B n=1 Tax=Lachnellula willkommii TaxID=215461 RepID=A0A559MCY6_9HELO|nr:Cyanobacterial phytochrome B [Lachnellula willkommii]
MSPQKSSIKHGTSPITASLTTDQDGKAESADVAQPKIERVFPIRLQVPSRQMNTAPPSPSPSPSQGTNGQTPFKPPTNSPKPAPREDNILTGPPNISTVPPAQTTETVGDYHVTSRFGYFSNGPERKSAVKTTATEQRIPDGIFLVRLVSENAESITGLRPQALFELRCWTDILVGSDKKEFVKKARLSRSWTPEDDSRTNPGIFTISLTSLLGAPRPLFCAVHFNAASDLIIVEFEARNDVFQSAEPVFPDRPISATNNKIPEEMRHPRTTRSQPLRLDRENGRQLGSMELFHILCEIQVGLFSYKKAVFLYGSRGASRLLGSLQAITFYYANWLGQAQMAKADSLASLLDIAVDLVQELTSFHRVMIYRFDETNAGIVVAEYFHPRATTDSYLNLHFPASDIPPQARELYVINKIRILYNREEDTARLMCRTLEDAKNPLDMKHSYLRAMSPIHIKYLRNMGVMATLSISLMVDNKLWGLISCHNYGAGLRVSLPVRELCRSIGEVCSTHIERLLNAARVRVRRPLSAATQKTSPNAFIAASFPDLLNMFDADLGFLAIRGEARTIGKIHAYSEAIALLQYIRQRSFTEVFASQNVNKDCPDIIYEPGIAVLVGMLVIPLAPNGTDFIVFFRKTKEKEIIWAGNPNEKENSGKTAYLEPRSSFARWSQQVTGTSRGWNEDQLDSATTLSTIYGRFIDVWRQKDSIVQKNRLTRLLIKNAGHEVRTPLNSIINYLEVALEGPLDERARHQLQCSLQASKLLVFAANNLLSLTEAEEIDFKDHEQNVDLRRMITDLCKVFKAGGTKRNLEQLHGDEAIPEYVRCDPTGLRQVLSNLLTNSIEHGSGKLIQIGLRHLSTAESHTLIEIFFQDEGKGLSEKELDSIFQDLEQVLDEDESQPLDCGIGSETQRPTSIGLGLALTARFVRFNSGQISMSSEYGRGSRVSIKIPFRKALSQKAPIDLSLPTPLGGIPSRPFPTTGGASHRSAHPGTVEISTGPVFTAVTDNTPASETLSTTPLTSFDQPDSRSHTLYPFPKVFVHRPRFHVLIAEDNPLNSRLLEARLTKRGHTMKVTVDGQMCADTFKREPAAYDLILMDLQMPLVDGPASTRLIRAFEKSTHPYLSPAAQSYGRIPIIAVSASLSEPSLNDYLTTGFDGWILKPIDFSRLETIMAATLDEVLRRDLRYGNGSWDRGGWFGGVVDGIEGRGCESEAGVETPRPK